MNFVSPTRAFCWSMFRTTVRRKGNAMLFLLLTIAALAATRAAQSALASLRSLPRSNEDWIWY